MFLNRIRFYEENLSVEQICPSQVKIPFNSRKKPEFTILFCITLKQFFVQTQDTSLNILRAPIEVKHSIFPTLLILYFMLHKGCALDVTSPRNFNFVIRGCISFQRTLMSRGVCKEILQYCSALLLAIPTLFSWLKNNYGFQSNTSLCH